MALAPKLEFRQSQQLVMTPQLQQAIKLLQLSNLELTEFVEQQLEENPFLERASEGEPAEAPAASESEAPAVEALDLGRDDIAERAQDALDAEYNLPDPAAPEAPAADYRVNEWANVGAGGGGVSDEDREFGATLSRDISLSDHLTEQLQIATRDPHQLFIGAHLIDLVDEAGYFRDTVSAVAERLGAETSEVETVLRLIQTFEPSGVGARDLRECLTIQLAERGRLDPMMRVFLDNIERLAQGDLKGLMRATGADEEDVRDMIAEIRGLTPKPGLAFGGGAVQIVKPDVFVSPAEDGAWKIELNTDTLPRILVNQAYFAKVSKTKSSDGDKQFLSDQFANANWLVKSLDQRARTILKVSMEIVRQQDAFLLYGVKHLRPLNLKTIAEAISMHESTVSRVTSNKYMATPRGLFEMKFFFTAAIASATGGESHSAEAVRHRVRELITAEAADAVLSDDRIVEILAAEGVEIARRTVAKYREAMNIPSSVQRRRTALRRAI